MKGVIIELAFRYVPTLARDFSVTLDAQKARGYEIERVEGGLLTQVRKIAPLIIPVTIGSILGWRRHGQCHGPALFRASYAHVDPVVNLSLV